MEYPRCALEGFRYGYFSQELARALVWNRREEYMTSETKQCARLWSPVSQLDGLTISQPGYVWYIFSHLDIKPWDRVKEIGSGSCRTQAITLALTWSEGFVTGVEANKKMFDLWKHNIKKNFGRIPDHLELIHGDGLLHHTDVLYDKILFSAAFSPKRQGREQIAKQLCVGGKVIYPQFTHKIGTLEKSTYVCQLSLLTKKLDNKRDIKNLWACNFVPVVSEGKGPDGEVV